MNLKQKTISNVKWSFIESLSLKAIGFVLSIILARLLLPEDFGLLAVVNVFYLLVTLFVDGGLKEALIQKKDVKEVHYSSVFWMNLLIGVILYCLLYFAAPFIQSFYNFKDLSFLIRLQSLVLIIEAFGVIQIIKATKELNIKKITKARIPASLLSFAVGIFMAFKGYGVLSLIVQQLVNALLYNIFLLVTVKYIPQFKFDFTIIKELWKYGYKVILISLLSRFYAQFVSLIFAKYYPIVTLGLYTKARSFQNTPIEIITTTFNRGVYPTMIRLQDNVRGLRKVYLDNVHRLTFIMVLINVFIFFNSEPIILILFGEKWKGMTVFLQISALSTIFQPMMNQAISVFKANGKPQFVLRIELISKIISLLLIFGMISNFSLEMVFIGLSIIFTIISFLYFYVLSSTLRYNFSNEFFKLFIMILTHFLMGFITHKLCELFIDNSFLYLIVAGIIFYGLSYIVSVFSKIYTIQKLLK
jgi:teichuronic acid exporter